MTIEEFIHELKKLNINITEEQLENLTIYKNMLIEYNKKFNLTAITQEEDIYLKHFYDSLTLALSVNLEGNLKLLDVGTGAGFPGLVLKIVFPNLDITLVDSNHKKTLFLKNVIESLNLKNIKCLISRVEDLDDTYREYFDIITSRAVAHSRILTELAIPFLKVSGLFLPMKSNIEEELIETIPTIKVLNCKLIKVYEFNLPIEGSKRTILKIQKLSKTPNIYPRSYDKIKKKPLK